MKVQARAVNSKRHTIGYKIGSQWRTRAQAVRLAQRGQVENVFLREGGNDEIHLVGANGFRLESDIPTYVEPKAYTARYGS